MLMILFNFGGYILSISELIGGIMSILKLIGGIIANICLFHFDTLLLPPKNFIKFDGQGGRSSKVRFTVLYKSISNIE